MCVLLYIYINIVSKNTSIANIKATFKADKFTKSYLICLASVLKGSGSKLKNCSTLSHTIGSLLT